MTKAKKAWWYFYDNFIEFPIICVLCAAMLIIIAVLFVFEWTLWRLPVQIIREKKFSTDVMFHATLNSYVNTMFDRWIYNT